MVIITAHLHIKERDQEMNDVPDARFHSNVGHAGNHIASIEHSVHRGHESKIEDSDIVGRDVHNTDDARREVESED